MKKVFACLIGTLLCILMVTCKKDYLFTNALSSSSRSLIENAHNYFNDSVLSSTTKSNISNQRCNTPKTSLWSKAYVIPFMASKAVVVPIVYSKPYYIESNFCGTNLFSINELAALVIYQDAKQRYHAEMVTAFPDSNYANHLNGSFSGIIFVDDWSGNPIAKYKYSRNGEVQRYKNKPSKIPENSLSDPANRKATNSIDFRVVTTCYEIQGYNYSPATGEYFYWSEFAGCSSSYVESYAPDNGSGASYGTVPFGGGSRPNPISPAALLNISPGSNPIGNISDYNKCFTNVGGSDHTYLVTVAVNQPLPGTRDPWGFNGEGSSATGNPINAGHTFLILSEIYGGTTITRNVGFYPTGRVNPKYSSIQGQLNNDASHGYNISLTISLTNAEFFEILNYVAMGNTSGFMYDLNSNNCTTFALAALSSAGINLPRTYGYWPDGDGLDPGDLGEDIRSMRLSSNMTRNTVGNAHPNIGTCN